MEHRNATTGLTIQGRIDKRVHSTEELQSAVENWDSLTKRQKMLVAKPPESIDFDRVDEENTEYANLSVEPEEHETIHNVTTDRLHEYFVDNLDPAQTAAEDNLTASWMGLGNDAASGTATSDTDLNNRVYEETVTDHADNGKELLASTFVDSTEANGYTLDEIGLFTGDPANLTNADVFLINHATFADVTKDNSKTVTFDVTLTFSDV